MTPTTPPTLTPPRWQRAAAFQAPASPPATRSLAVAPETVAVVVGGEEPQAVLESGETLPLRWALPYHAELVPGDVVQVLRQGPRCYVIGVLRCARGLRLLLADDAQLRGYRLRLRGDRGLKLSTADLRIRARQLSYDATEISERLGGAVRRVLGRLTIRARNARTIVAGEHHTRAKQRRGVGAESHRLDGGLVQFGQ